MTSPGRVAAVNFKRARKELGAALEALTGAGRAAFQEFKPLLAQLLPWQRKEWAAEQFEQTKNPLFAWEAYRLFRSAGEPLPNWLLAYFDEIADRIATLEIELQGQQKGGTMGRVGIAAGFRSGRDFDAYRKRLQSFAIALAVLKKRPIEGKMTYDFESTAKELGLSMSTVQRSWEDHKRLYPRLFSESTRLPGK